MPTKLPLSFAALFALAVLSGCRQVTIVNFMPGVNDPSEVYPLVVEAPPMKGRVFLNSVHETVGFYDLKPVVTIYAWGCIAGTVAISGQALYEGLTDRVTVELHLDNSGAPCPTAHDGGSLAPADAGAGGGGGMTILPGSGGITVGPDGGGQGGEPDGSGGAAGTGGVTGSGGSDGGADAGGGAGGECDDGGVHDGSVDLGACMPPTDSPPDAGTVTSTLACSDYCAQIFPIDIGGVLCTGLYDNVRECESYCTRAAWPIGTGSPSDKEDTITCRRTALTMARDQAPSDRTAKCNVGGPTGGSGTDCGYTIGMCGKFCTALTRICGGNRDACISACTTPAATCRFPWLVHAVSDQRYCTLVDLTAPSCIVPGC